MVLVVLALFTARTWTKGLAMKYMVNIPWHGVEKGQVLELEKVHPSLKANVVLIPEVLEAGEAEGKAKSEAQAIIDKANSDAELIISEAEGKAKEILLEAEKKAGELTPATPEATADKKAPAKK